MPNNIYKKPDSELRTRQTPNLKDALFKAENDALKGLGGWLILVGIGIVFNPIRLLLESQTSFLPIFTDGTWELLTNPASESFVPYFGIFLIFEILANVVFLLFSVYMIVLFFSEHYLFPTAFISFFVAQLTFLLLDAALASFLFDIPFFDGPTIDGLTRTSLILLIWAPYMLVSKRVKVTFVKHKPVENYGRDL